MTERAINSPHAAMHSERPTFGPRNPATLAKLPMEDSDSNHQCLAPGEPLPPGAWQLLSGALRLDLHGDGPPRLVQLALPGDLLGLEPWFSDEREPRATALVACRIQRLCRPPVEDAQAAVALLSRALRQQRQRMVDMNDLRTGSTPDRVKRLLLLLHGDARAADAPGGPPPAHALPRIKDIAALVDSAHETVSRILSGLRRLDVLQERHARCASFDRQALDDCKLPKGMTRSAAWLRPPDRVRPSVKA